jgi:hypothetical protein
MQTYLDMPVLAIESMFDCVRHELINDRAYRRPYVHVDDNPELHVDFERNLIAPQIVEILEASHHRAQVSTEIDVLAMFAKTQQVVKERHHGEHFAPDVPVVSAYLRVFRLASIALKHRHDVTSVNLPLINRGGAYGILEVDYREQTAIGALEMSFLASVASALAERVEHHRARAAITAERLRPDVQRSRAAHRWQKCSSGAPATTCSSSKRSTAWATKQSAGLQARWRRGIRQAKPWPP